MSSHAYTRTLVDGYWNLTPANLAPVVKAQFPGIAFQIMFTGAVTEIVFGYELTSTEQTDLDAVVAGAIADYSGPPAPEAEPEPETGAANGRFQRTKSTQTTNDTPVVVDTYTTLAADRVIDMTIRIIGRDTTSGDILKYVIESTFERTGTTVTEKDTDIFSSIQDDMSWDVNLVISSLDIRIEVTGDATNTVEWRCHVEVNEHG